MMALLRVKGNADAQLPAVLAGAVAELLPQGKLLLPDLFGVERKGPARMGQLQRAAPRASFSYMCAEIQSYIS